MKAFKKLLKYVNLYIHGLSLAKNEKRTIEKNVKYIFTFEDLKRRLILSHRNFFFKPTYKFYDLCERDIQEAVNKILEHCDLKNIYVRITHERLVPSRDLKCLGQYSTEVPGLTYILSPSHYTIFVSKQYSSETKGAVLAHEIAHIYAIAKNIAFKTKSDRKTEFIEQMTDLLAICLGLGKLMIRGNTYSFVKDDKEFFGSLGYLKGDILTYAQCFLEYKLLNQEIIEIKKVS